MRGKLALVTRTKTNTFEKKPRRGGTPAKERMIRLSAFVNGLEASRSARESNVRKLVLRTWVKVAKSASDVRL